MAVPDYQSLMLPLLKIAGVGTGDLRSREVIERLADALRLSEEDRNALLPSGRKTYFYDRAQWAKTYMAKAQLLENVRRGYFRVTDRGRQVLARNPERIDNAFLAQFPEFREAMARVTEAGAGDSAEELPTAPPPAVGDALATKLTPDDTIREAHARLEAELAEDLLQRILDAPPAFFERVVVDLLLAMGYGGSRAEAGRALGRSGDGGVDGVIDEDTLGLDRIYVQAKRYAESSPIGPGAIRDFFGSLDRFKASKGLFVTTSSFTSTARETAEMLSKRIVLMDGQHFARQMIRFNVGCRIEETYHVKKVDEDFFE